MGFFDWFNEPDVPSIATTPWINICFQIWWKAPNDLTEQQIDKEISNNKGHYLPNVINRSEQLKIRKAWITKSYKITDDNPNNYDDLTRTQINLLGKAAFKNEAKNWTAIFNIQTNYSPIEFMREGRGLKRVDKEITAQYGIPYKATISIAYPGFNFNNEPIIQARLETIWLSHRVIDRLELYSKSPSVDRECFTDKGIFDFIEFYRKNLKNLKGTEAKNCVRWLKAVDKLLMNYK